MCIRDRNSVVYFVGDELPLAFTGSYVANRIDLSKTVIAVTGGGTFPEGTVFEASKLAKPEKEGAVFTGWVDSDGDPVTAPQAGKTLSLIHI